jgi:PEP-CTERM motif
MHTPRALTPRTACLASLLALAFLWPSPVAAGPFFFSTGNPDGLIATLSRPAGGGHIQTETADDFILSQQTRINSATFVGLLPLGAPLGNITQVEIEFYHVFPKDSLNPPSGNVFTRVNSPADVEIGAATRDSLTGSLSFLASLLSANFTVTNSVVNGINKFPNQFTGGEGSVSGEEVSISVTFTLPVDLPPDHYFFRPEVELSSGAFLWLSAPKPIVGGTGPFNADLQSWIRNDNLAPDWSRIGSDITHQGPFNATFSLTGETVPEPSALMLLGSGLLGIGAYRAWRRRR